MNLVKYSATICSAGKYAIYTLPVVTQLAPKQYHMLICLVIQLLEAALFVANSMVLLIHD